MKRLKTKNLTIAPTDRSFMSRSSWRVNGRAEGIAAFLPPLDCGRVGDSSSAEERCVDFAKNFPSIQ